MPKKESKKTLTKNKKDKDVNVESDSDDMLLNESEKDVNIKVKTDNDDLDNLDVEDEDIDSEIEDEDKLEDDEEIGDEIEDDVGSEDSDLVRDGKTKCLYKYAEDVSEDDLDIIEEEFFSDDQDDETLPNRVPDDERITKPIMTKYERVRLLGIRTRQLALGAKPMIKNSESLSSKEIAELELENNIIPLIIIRPLPNGRKEYWKVSELSY